jgi:hypothetical protein
MKKQAEIGSYRRLGFCKKLQPLRISNREKKEDFLIAMLEWREYSYEYYP